MREFNGSRQPHTREDFLDALNGPSLHEKEEVEKFLLAVVARFKAFKKRVPSTSFVGKRPKYASASKAKSSVLSQLLGLENVLFHDFIEDELVSEDVSEQRAPGSLPDSVPIESEEERAAREEDEMAVIDAVGDYASKKNMRNDHTTRCDHTISKKWTFVHTENVLITPSTFDHPSTFCSHR